MHIYQSHKIKKEESPHALEDFRTRLRTQTSTSEHKHQHPLVDIKKNNKMAGTDIANVKERHEQIKT